MFPDIGVEVASRCAILKHETSKLRSHVLKNPWLSISRKINVLQTYILTKGLFQAGAWPTLKPQLYKKLHSCVLSMYRDVCGHTLHSKDTESIVPETIFCDDDIIFTCVL